MLYGLSIKHPARGSGKCGGHTEPADNKDRQGRSGTAGPGRTKARPEREENETPGIIHPWRYRYDGMVFRRKTGEADTYGI